MPSSKFYKKPNIKINHICTSGIIVRDNKVLLGHRCYHRINAWMSPGGRCEENETPEETLLREIQEEIGVTDARIEIKLGEKSGVYKNKTGRDKVLMFKVFTAQEPCLMEPEKFMEWKWFDLNELPDNLLDHKDKEFFIKALQI